MSQTVERLRSALRHGGWQGQSPRCRHGFGNVRVSVTDEEKAAILQAGEESGRYQRWVSAKSHVDGMARLMEHGVEVNIVEDRQPFIGAVAPVMEKYKPEIGAELVDRVPAPGQ